MPWRAYRFRPQLIPTLASLMLIPLFLHLSSWQAGKAEAKAGLQAQLEARQHAEPQDFPQMQPAAQDQDWRYLRVRVRGRYLPHGGFLLDNQLHRGRAGFHVITPLRLDDGRIVLVNRGWVAFSGDRRDLPRIVTPDLTVTLDGHLWPPHQPRLDARHHPRPGDAIWQLIDMQLLQEQLDNRLQPLLLRLDPHSEGGGFERVWEAPATDIDKHRNYAGQWRLIAAATLLAWFFLGWQRPDQEPVS